MIGNKTLVICGRGNRNAPKWGQNFDIYKFIYFRKAIGNVCSVFVPSI